MRRLWVALVVGFTLLFAQQAAIRHDVGHLGGAIQAAWAQDVGQGPGSSLPDEPPSTDDVCSLCLAFAPMGACAVTSAASLDLLTLGHARSALVEPLSLDAVAPSQRSRGPPLMS